MFSELIQWFSQIYNVEALVTWGGLIGMTVIVFAETGLLIGFFLPGDSLLVAAGLLTANGMFDTHVLLTCTVLSVAAIAGDTVGYWFGAKTGPLLFTRPKSLLFNPKHLIRTHEFYERHGGKTIIIARFMPIIRTFAPFVAGMATMRYPRFLSFNVLGAALWVGPLVMAGYWFGNLPLIKNNLTLVIFGIILLSLLPLFVGWL
ncbi:MAG: VTT domain-containing protein, partial [Candidatus Omnitrophica bacterium]|nr:VTT domain-containing protein [Candidatus Omnitrophota bacterium]